MNELHQSQSRVTVRRINIQMLGAVFFGSTAWIIWPTSWKWWGLGFIAIICALEATALLIAAMRNIWQLYMRDKELDKLRQKGVAQKSSRLASRKDLKDARMLND